MFLLLLSLLVDPSTYVGNVYGAVTANGRPVPGATVTLVEAGLSATTDDGGQYLIRSVPTPGDGARYTVAVTHPDYVRAEVHAHVLPGAVMALEANARLSPAGSTIELRYRHERAFTAQPRARTATDNFTRTVFATREGLVGFTTANGHVIIENDRFVALPSRRALSTNFGFERQVRIRFGGRTVVAPVWDVGPWNTRDDYWNPASIRQTFQDLPRGKPESEAAFLEGYNGGLDERGRRVLNPAGIDLADGTFRIDLALPDNSWIEVEYLWLDEAGPSITALSPPTTTTNTATVEAQIIDASPIEAAEYYVDGEGPFPAIAADGAFDSTSETVRVNLVTSANRTFSIRARDAYGNWSEPATVTITTAPPSRKRRAVVAH